VLRTAETIQGLQDLAHVAASRGVARAKLQLHPAELGGIAVRIEVKPEGLTALIAADRPEAVEALQQAGAELRRALEDRGLTVISLDVDLASSEAGTHQDPATREREDATTQAGRRTDGTDAAADVDGMEPDDHSTPAGPPAGALVDVLA
jgi:flagellar hook-length control protein FliK